MAAAAWLWTHIESVAFWTDMLMPAKLHRFYRKNLKVGAAFIGIIGLLFISGAVLGRGQ